MASGLEILVYFFGCRYATATVNRFKIMSRLIIELKQGPE